MTKEAILKKLIADYKTFADFIVQLTDEELMYAPDEKWTAGQQLDHLIRAVSSLAAGLRLPKLALRMIFGKSNRHSGSYEDLVKKYIGKLQSGGKASGRYIPLQIMPADKQAKNEKLLKKVNQLCENIKSYSEIQLDEYILPHPLLGKLTLREMMYFTIYHAEHHLKQAMKNLRG